MPNRVASIFGSYDLFAKAIPGTAFLIGILSLLPPTNFPETAIQSTLLLTTAIVIFAILGFIVGQALHSLAVSIERVMYKFGSHLYHGADLLQPGFWETTRVSDLEETPERYDRPEDWPDGGIYPRWAAGLVAKTYVPLILVCYEILVPHRLLFTRHLKSKYSRDGKPTLLYRRFSETVFNHLVTDRIAEEDYSDLYTIIMSQQEFIGTGRSRQFQAIFSFCRSMWVTLGFFAVAYSGVMIFDSGFFSIRALSYSPLITDFFPESTALPFITVWMILLILFFMLGEKYYKQDFVDYVIADFFTSTSDSMESHILSD